LPKNCQKSFLKSASKDDFSLHSEDFFPQKPFKNFFHYFPIYQGKELYLCKSDHLLFNFLPTKTALSYLIY